MSQDAQQLDAMRHSAAHMLAAAVLKLYPGTKLGIGPTIEHGFYYDFLFPEGVVVGDNELQKIENVMKNIAGEGHAFVGKPVSVDEARAFEKDQPFKLELIEEFAKEGKDLTLYESGPFTDLCRGGHAQNTKEIPQGGLKLDRVAGAYWRGDEKKQMLTRIYGYLFPSKAELDAHVLMIEEAKKRDHRKIGKEQGLFVFSELVGAGLPLWTPKGTLLRDTLNDFVWSLRRQNGYDRVTIPHITKRELYETSGHWAKYADDLFKIQTRDGHLFAMKPMNCPHHTQIYASEQRSYRDLPQRYAETTMVYRDEQTGELAGLSRVLSITQDDAHVFCRVNQVRQEAEIVWGIIEKFYGTFGFTLSMRLSRRDPSTPEKYLGSVEDWDKAEGALKEILTAKGVDWIDGPGEAAFYGPKIDFMAKDALGRVWQVATIQLDFNQPNNFDLTCVNEKGEKERIVMIHCAIMGSIERFMSIIIEHLAGIWPVWLSPVQVRVIPVSEKHIGGATDMVKRFREAGVRVDSDMSNETVGKKIRAGATSKVPYIVVVGDKELSGEPLQVRVRGVEEPLVISETDFIVRILEETRERKA